MSNGNFIVSEKLVILPEERHTNRFFVEQEKLKQSFPQFKLTANNGVVNGCAGYLRTNVGSTYNIKISVDGSYPGKMPTVETVGWTIVAGCPHNYGATRPCVYASGLWRNFNTMAFLISKTALWLNKYEIWKKNRVWTGVQDGRKS